MTRYRFSMKQKKATKDPPLFPGASTFVAFLYMFFRQHMANYWFSNVSLPVQNNETLFNQNGTASAETLPRGYLK